MKYAFLDIETSWQKTITVIGIYRQGLGTTHLVAPRITRDALLETLVGVERLFTYNGARFDLPVIQEQLGIDLTQHVPHQDLMFDCWRQKLKGGLKKVEGRLGIHRDTDGVDGVQAMRMWDAHLQGNEEALELLLRYNKEDVENLEALAIKLGIIKN